jgi:hypothetical protein
MGGGGEKKEKMAKLLVTEKGEPALHTPSWGGRRSRVDQGNLED